MSLEGFGRNPLVEEGKLLNHQCYNREGNKVYMIDRIEPYKISSQHLWISINGPLTELARHCLEEKILPLSLDHDGLLGLRQGEVQPLEV